MAFSTFLEINHTLHPVCNSVYVRDEFITYVSGAWANASVRQDLQVTGSLVFQALRSLCDLTKYWTSSYLEQFYLSQYIGTHPTPVDLLQSQSESLVRQFISSTTNNFLLSLRLVRDISQANGLLSALFTNYYLALDVIYLASTPLEYNDQCSCSANSSCIEESVIFSNTSNSTYWVIPGFYRGCFIVEALLQSHLGCFFDQACLETFHSRLLSDHTMNTTALDQADLTKFAPNTTVGAILDELMVETWNWSAVYGKYFGACQPKECTYTMTGRNDAIYIVTTVIGLIGGLVTVLKFVVPRLVVLLMRRRETNAGNYWRSHWRTHDAYVVLTRDERDHSEAYIVFFVFESSSKSYGMLMYFPEV